MKSIKEIVEKLSVVLENTETLMNEEKLNLEEFLNFTASTLADAQENGQFEGVEDFVPTASILLQEYACGGGLSKEWQSEFDEFVEDLNGFLAEKFED